MNRRRSIPDPLAPIKAPTWLVVRNAWGDALETTPLLPMADLRAILNAARTERLANGWKADEIGRCCSFFFCTKDGVRLQVGIERRDPDNPSLGHR